MIEFNNSEYKRRDYGTYHDHGREDFAAHAGLDEVVPGQLIECDLDLVLSNDVTAPIAIKEFKKLGLEKVFDPTKIALVPDHYVPDERY